MKKSIILVMVVVFATLALSACGDVVGKIAVTSFEKMQEKAQVTTTENKTSISSPTGNVFEYGTDGTAMRLPIAPFAEAGLDLNKLPEYITTKNDMLIIRQEYKARDFKTFVEKYRDKIDYHEALDHYGIDMGNGNKFEWAKDLETNDKDIVFVLNPKPFIDAGVNVENVKGFVYAEVEIKKGVKEFKLLYPFDLNNITAQTTPETTAQPSNDAPLASALPEIANPIQEKAVNQDKPILAPTQTPMPTASAKEAVATQSPMQTPQPKEKFDEFLLQVI